jgi:outer membrane cobalamin receptor
MSVVYRLTSISLITLFTLSVSSGAARIRGTVLDASGKSIAGARIECAGKLATSGLDGRFAIPDAANCEALVSAPGFDSVKTMIESTGEARVTLQVAGLSQRIVVSATRSETTVEEAGVSASIITRSDLEQREFPPVLDVLREVPGLSVSRNGRQGGLTSVYARGAQRTATLVLLDGVSLNDPGGEINFANLTSSAVDRIEVVRSPESVLFGAEASAAVVQLFTRRGDPESKVPHGFLTYERGSFQTDRWLAGLSGGAADRFDYSLTAEQEHTVGEFHNDFHRNTSGTANLGYRLAPSTSLRGTFQSYDAGLGTPGEVGYGIFNYDANQFSRDYTVSLRLDDARGRHYLQRASFNYHKLHDVFTDHGLGGPYNLAALVRDVTSPQKRTYMVGLLDPTRLPSASSLAPDMRIVTNTVYMWPMDPYVSDTSRKTGEYQGTVTHTGGAFIFGYEFERQEGRLSSYDVSRDNHGVFLLKQQRLGRRVFVSAGLRSEHSSAFGNKWAPRGTVSVLAAGEHGPLSSTYFRVSAGRGITEPSLLQNFAREAWYTGNPNLRPEKTSTYEAGVVQEWFGRRLRTEAAVFHNSFTDLIAFVSKPAPIWGSWENVEASKARGLEFSAQARPMKYVTVNAAYTRLWTRIVTSNAPSSAFTGIGQELGRRPGNSGSISLSVAPARWSFQAGGVAVGERQDSDVFGVTRNPGYQNVYAGASWRAHKHIAPFFRADNLLNARYYEVLGYSCLSRTLKGGLRLEW